jgi:shikimate kinase
MRFVDSDHAIEARTGASIPWIFEIEGEASFRRREADMIRELTAQRGIVLATGGGAVLDAGQPRLLAERGTVIYLRASIGSILQRTAHDKNRPLLQTADPRRKLEDLTALSASRCTARSRTSSSIPADLTYNRWFRQYWTSSGAGRGAPRRARHAHI